MTDSRNQWTTDARYFEHSKVVNPIDHQTPKVPTADFDQCLHEQGESRIIPLDLSNKVLCPVRAPARAFAPTSFVSNRVIASVHRRMPPLSFISSSVAKVGEINRETIPWTPHDLFTLPVGSATHFAECDTALYWVR